MRYRTAGISVIVLCLSAADASSAVVLECPASIQERPSVSSQAKDWEPVVESAARPLEQVGFSLFHPSKKGTLVPDATQRKKLEERVTWRFPREANDEYWISCSYTGTTAVLTRRLDTTIAQCTVTYTLLPSGSRQRVQNISCQ